MPKIKTNRIETYYEEYGEGHPIIFLHGAGSDHRIWAQQTQDLADEYRVIVYDIRGHGRTGPSDEEKYSIDLYAEDLDAFIDSLDLDNPVICGLSMGGMISQRYASLHPDKISGVVTLGATTPKIFTRTEWFQIKVLMKAVNGISKIIDPERVQSALMWIGKKLYGEEAAGNQEKAEKIQERHSEDVPEMTDEEEDKLSNALSSYFSIEIDHSNISVPALIMCGEHEYSIQKNHIEYMESEIPDVRTRQIPDAGHHSHVDNPEFIVEELRDFIDTRVSPS